MIYIFSGEDTKKKNDASEKLIDSTAKDRDVLRISKKDFNQEHFENLTASSGLFSPSSLVVLLGVLEDDDIKGLILQRLLAMMDSANDFIFLEESLAKPVSGAFTKAGAKVETFDLLREKKERFNSFILANALGVRDRLNLWIGFRQAIRAGTSLEELAGVLFWKTKDMILKKTFAKFSEQELQVLAGRLSYLLPQARKQGEDDELAFEHLLLEAF